MNNNYNNNYNNNNNKLTLINRPLLTKQQQIININRNNNNITKKCLLIGINYKKTQYETNNNDIQNLKDHMTKNKYFTEQEIIMMNDDSIISLYPTRVNIMLQFNKLIAFCKLNSKKKTSTIIFSIFRYIFFS